MFKFLHLAKTYRSKVVVCVGQFNAAGANGDKVRTESESEVGSFLTLPRLAWMHVRIGMVF